MDCEKILNYLRFELEKYIKKNGVRSLVLGVSGGIDSCLVAAIAHPVCAVLKIPLIGVMLPTSTNSFGEQNRAKDVCHEFCHLVINQDISDLSEFLIRHLDIEDKVRKGNIKARLRMMILYDHAQATGGMVLSTDNYTELQLGFWTLHGDVGDFGLIQNLWKTEVYELSKYIAEKINSKSLRDCIEAVPTDGLGITKSDLEAIGAKSYEEVDGILKNVLSGKPYEDGSVSKRHFATEFKRNNPFNLERVIQDDFV